MIIKFLKRQFIIVIATLRTIPRYFAFTNRLPAEVGNDWLLDIKNVDSIAQQIFDEELEEMQKEGWFKFV